MFFKLGKLLLPSKKNFFLPVNALQVKLDMCLFFFFRKSGASLFGKTMDRLTSAYTDT